MTAAAEWIARRRKLADAATEGPWCYGGQGWVFAEALLRSGDGEPPGMRDLLASVGTSDEDALFIADSRISLPRALDALEAVLTVVAPAGAEKFGPDFEAGLAKGLQLARAAIESALRADA